MKMIIIILMIAVLTIGGKVYSQTTTVDTDVISPGKEGAFSSRALEFDPSGNPGIAYFHQVDKEIKFAYWNGSFWDKSIVESSITAGPPSIAFKSSGNPVLAYHDLDNNQLKCAQRNGSSWEIEIVEANTGEESSLALDNQGYPAISYHDDSGDDLMYAHWNGSSWDITTVDSNSNSCSFTSLAFNHLGCPAITYYDEGLDDTIKCVYWNGSSWEPPEIIDPDPSLVAGEETSLAFDHEGHAHVSYRDDNEDFLRHAERIGSTWNITIVPGTSDVCSYTSLALDKSEFPSITYYDEGSDHALKYISWNGHSWDSPMIVAKATEESSSLSFDSSGNMGICYYDSDRKLKFAALDENGNVVLEIDPKCLSTKLKAASTLCTALMNCWVKDIKDINHKYEVKDFTGVAIQKFETSWGKAQDKADNKELNCDAGSSEKIGEMINDALESIYDYIYSNTDQGNKASITLGSDLLKAAGKRCSSLLNAQSAYLKDESTQKDAKLSSAISKANKTFSDSFKKAKAKAAKKGLSCDDSIKTYLEGAIDDLKLDILSGMGI